MAMKKRFDHIHSIQKRIPKPSAFLSMPVDEKANIIDRLFMHRLLLARHRQVLNKAPFLRQSRRLFAVHTKLPPFSGGIRRGITDHVLDAKRMSRGLPSV